LKETDVPNFEVENNFVRLVADMTKSEIVDLKRQLEKKSPGSLEIVPLRKEDTEQLIVDCKAIFLKEAEMMERWVDERGTNGLERLRLLDKGTEVCQFQA